MNLFILTLLIIILVVVAYVLSHKISIRLPALVSSQVSAPAPALVPASVQPPSDWYRPCQNEEDYITSEELKNLSLEEAKKYIYLHMPDNKVFCYDIMSFKESCQKFIEDFQFTGTTQNQFQRVRELYNNRKGEGTLWRLPYPLYYIDNMDQINTLARLEGGKHYQLEASRKSGAIWGVETIKSGNIVSGAHGQDKELDVYKLRPQ
jgi:biopolymer transport protein ExbD